MSGNFPRLRVAFVVLSVALVFSVYLGFSEDSNYEQHRAASVPPMPTAKFEHFA